MGILDIFKKKKKEPTYSVYIPSKSEQAKGKTNLPSYDVGFIGPLPKGSSRVQSPQITPDNSSKRFSGGGGGSGGGSSTPAPTQTIAPIVQSTSTNQAEVQRELARQRAEQQRIEQIRESQRIRQQQVRTGSQQQINITSKKQEPYLTTVQTSTYKDSKGKNIPVTEVIYVDPQKKFDRKATKEETEFYRSQDKDLVSSSKKPSLYQKSGAKEKIDILKSKINELEYSTGEGLGDITTSAIEKVEKRTGLNLPSTIKEAKQNIESSNKLLLDLGVPKSFVKVGSVGAYTGVGAVEEIKTKPLQYGVIAGISAGIGAGSSGLVSLTSKLGKTAGTITKVGTIAGGIGLTGVYAYDVGKRISVSKTDEQLGRTLSQVGLETGFAVGGFKAGRKAYDKFSVLGRDFVPIEDLVPQDVLTGKKTFVESSSYGYRGKTGLPKQKFDLKVFEQKKYGFHTTPDKFYTNTIKVSKGTSEFEGLYIAPDVSIYFGKTGKGYKLFPTSISELLATNKPAIAKITPKGFTLEQSRSFGYAFVTGVKPELEAVVKVGSQFQKIGKGKYTSFGGKNILLDEFISLDESIIGSSKLNKKLYSPSEISSSYRFGSREPLIESESLSYTGKQSSSKSLSSSKIIIRPSSSIINSKVKTSSKIISSSEKRISPSFSNIVKGSDLKTSKTKIPSLVKSPKSSLRSPNSTIPYSNITSLITIPRTPELPKTIKPRVRSRRKPRLRTLPTYSVLIRRRGKFKQIGEDLLLGRALKVGDLRIRQTLGRTFKIKKSGRKKDVFDTDINFNPSPKVFRTYKIKKGKKESLPFGTFIQKSKYSLSNPLEVLEIKQSRRRKRR